MRAITDRQARTCESSTDRRCRCRCGGVAHGAGRLRADQPIDHQLPADDPHRLNPGRPMALFANG